MKRLGVPAPEVLQMAMEAGAALVYTPTTGWYLEPAPELLHLLDPAEEPARPRQPMVRAT